MRALLTLQLLAGLAAQQPEQAPAAQALERFTMLGNLQKAVVLRRIVARLSADPDPHLQRILAHDQPLDDLPLATAQDWHRAEDWAPGVAPARRLIRED